ncbi:MAG: glycosyltransferase family 4 protein [Desulfobacterales bacterium]
MNILLLAPHPFFQNRGTPIAVKLMLEALSAKGHRFTVLTYPEGEDVKVADCDIIRLPELPGVRNIKPGPSWKKIVYDLFMFLKIQKLIASNQFHLIHAVEESALIAKFVKKRWGIPFVYDMDSSLPDQIVEKYSFLKFFLPVFKSIEKRMVNGCIGVIPVCKAIEASVRKINHEKLIQRLEDVSLLSPGLVGQKAEQQPIHIDGPKIMYIGNLEKYQGIDLLLQSFQRLLKKQPRANLIIIGGSDKEIDHYKHVADRSMIGKKIRFLGPRPIADLPVFVKQADILVSPRIKGYNTPMKIFSYLDSGRAVLATNLPTHTQVLDDEVSFLVEPTPQSMADGMVQLLKNASLRKRLAMNAKNRVRQEYSLDAFNRKISHFYKIIENKI